MCRRDATNFYAGASVIGLDVEGQDLTGLGFDLATPEIEPQRSLEDTDFDKTPDDQEIIRGQRPSISVVMVMSNDRPSVDASIRSVLAEPLVGELLIADNGVSTGGDVLASLALQEPRVSLFVGQGNVGLARAANLAASAARGDYLIFLDPDIVLQPGCVLGLVLELDKLSGPSIVGADVRNARRKAVSFGLETAKLQANNKRVAVPSGQSASFAKVNLSGCFCLRRTEFTNLDGFDEGYFLHIEDVDLSWRASKSGGVVAISSRAKAIRAGPKHPTLREEFHQGVGMSRYLIKKSDSLVSYTLAIYAAPAIMMLSMLRPLWRRQK